MGFFEKGWFILCVYWFVVVLDLKVVVFLFWIIYSFILFLVFLYGSNWDNFYWVIIEVKRGNVILERWYIV